ncbi:MAG: serine/threonine protein kinase [Myxococcales bacterium]|nr:serine/threonine protein kinase [Myxococcales bacterium]MCB9668389.1 serine/threonine protein kinase [Alphaproteobacteria bacterium]MCB9690627.1 serine/threonine protein kinase [Alphaproteobacteria bacterium]
MDADRRQYEVRAPVGKGGFGTVYEARLLGEGGFSKRVALKVLRRDLDDAEDIAQRQRDEARILGLIRHRAVVHVDGLVQLNGRWVVVMEFIDGLDLNKIMKQHGRLPSSVAIQVIGEVAGALHVAYHTDGPDGRPLRLLHRDIKPGNITVTTAGEVKVLDFGVARADFDLREAETRSVRFGSMGYMSPERLEGEDLAAGDIYSLGVLLWEMLCGTRFGQTQLARKKQVARVEEQLEVLKGKLENAPEGLVQLVREMLAFFPQDRPTGRDVERRCGELLREVNGPLLRDWSEHEIPRLQHGVQPPEDEEGLTGTILVEGKPDLAAPPAPSASSGGGSPAWTLLKALVVTLLVVLIVVMFAVVGFGGLLLGSMLAR